MQQGLLITEPAHLAAAVASASQTLGTCDVAHIRVFSAVLALGRFEHARAALRNSTPGDALLPLRAARYAAWTGDLRTLAGIWPRITAALQLVQGLAPDLRLRTYTELSGAATDLGDPQLSARLHGLARTERAALATGAPDPAAASTDPPDSADTACADATRALFEAMRHLGADPDATRGRLGLSPDLTRGGLSVERLRFGDGEISLRATVDGGVVTVVVAQAAGAVPVTVLLEPRLAGGVRDAEVDGKPASLALREEDGTTHVPVQLVLDEPRTLRLVTA